MKQEATFDFALLEIVDELLVFLGTECRGDQRLRFTAREKRGAVNARQPTNLTGDRSNLRKPSPVGTATFVQDVVAEDIFFQVIEDEFRHLSSFRLIFWIGIGNFFLERV